MKSKLKNPDLARQNGDDFVKKCVKKRVTEDFAPEGEQFFYDAEFEYNPEDKKNGCGPLLFIGVLPSEWRAYMKKNKSKASIAAGRCLPAAEDPSIINLQVKLGKGGKQKYLKLINKDILKPFASARFVDDLLNPKVLEDDLPEQDPETDPDGEEFTADATLKELMEEAEELFNKLIPARPSVKSIIDALKAPLSDLSKIVVDDQLIANARSAAMTLGQLDLENLIKQTKNWLSGEVKKQVSEKAKDLQELVKKIESAVGDLEKMHPDTQKIEEGIEKLQKVAGPGQGDVQAPVNINAGKALESSFNLLGKQFGHIGLLGPILSKIVK